jgi:hypothetical protein
MRGDRGWWKHITIQGVVIYETIWYEIVGFSRLTYMLYKLDSKWGCRFLPHGKKGTHKLWISTRQAESNAQSLINLSAGIIPCQMKGIGNGRQDVQRLLLETWKNM